MSIYNAIANMGKDAGAGLNAYASAKYQHKQDKRRNALIDEDRAIREEDRQYGRDRNALADKRYEDERRQAIQQEAQQHAASTQQAVMQAKTPEQAQAIWEQGQQQAIDLGYLDPNNAQPWDQVGSQLYVDPMDQARAMGQVQTGILADRAGVVGGVENSLAADRARTTGEIGNDLHMDRLQGEAELKASLPPDPTVETPQQKRERDIAAGVEEARQKAEIVPAATRAKAQDKMRAANAIRQQLSKVEEAWSEIQNTMAAGPYGQTWLSPDRAAGQKFDTAVAALAPFIRQLTRTPGEGSMSDYESKLASAINPDRTNFESVTQEQIDNLYELVDVIESGYAEMTGKQPKKPKAVKGQDEQASTTSPSEDELMSLIDQYAD